MKIGDKINVTFLKEGDVRATQNREVITKELKIQSETPIGTKLDKEGRTVNIYDEELQERCAAHNVVIEGTNLFDVLSSMNVGETKEFEVSGSKSWSSIYQVKLNEIK